ncbi:MAG: NAD-dependent malic enzyme [Synergistaceae bacterium]|jgi:malate dehydrogenase (oxaloacetate-decarboxylating)|nr:NAD-dependent malic enzyme [Synergistaceae bacterium]
MREAVYTESLYLHRMTKGKIALASKMPVTTMRELSLAYTPGVAEPCREIGRDPNAIYEVTSKGNIVAVITDGSAVLGLGDIGPEAALPVMEGKSILFKNLGGVDSFPICIKTQNVDDFVKTVALITPSLGGINLEDIAAPRCFEIERKLKEICDIPVFHDDQHGTAVIVLAGLLNALKVVGKKTENVKVVIAGAGAAGIATCKFLKTAGVKKVVLCDREGAVYRGRTNRMNWAKEEIAQETNEDGEKGSLGDVLKGADVFLGMSGPGVATADMVKGMAPKAIVFAMANPTPEIFPDEAKAGGAAVIATGRSDFPNQINNCLGFPGLFRGALNVRAKTINEEMKLAAAYAIASLIPDSQLTPERIIPETMDPRVVPVVAESVAQAARDTGVARL